MSIFWEIAAHSVDHMFSLVFCLFVILFISRFGLEGWIWVLIVQFLIFACFLLTLKVDSRHEIILVAKCTVKSLLSLLYNIQIK